MRAPLSRLSWAGLLAVIACAGAGGMATEREPGAAADPTWRELPAQVCRDFFILPVAMNGRPERVLWMLYDTGASQSCIDPESLAEISDYDGRSGSVTLQEGTIGPIRWRELPAVTRQLDQISHALGFPLDGILAYSVFGELLVQLDYPAQTMRVASGRLPEADGETVFEISRRERRRPFIRLELDGRREELLIDSGSSSGFVAQARRGRDWQAAPVQTGVTVGIDGPRAEKSGRLRGDTTLFGRSFPNAVMRVTDDTELIGTQVLRHFELTFDVAGRRVRALPAAAGPVPPWPEATTGALLVAEEESYRVAALIPGGSAEQAGLREDDRIVAIDGVPHAERGCQRDRLLGGEVRRLDVVRGEERLWFDVTAQEVLPVPEAWRDRVTRRDRGEELRALPWWQATRAAPLLFVSDRDGDSELYLRWTGEVAGGADVGADDDRGADWQPLTHDDGGDNWPQWSPDGAQIAFQSNRHGNLDLFLVAADGSGLRRLTDHPAHDYLPSWSADGEYLHFASWREAEARGEDSPRLYALHLATGVIAPLIDRPLGTSSGVAASPDGQLLLAGFRDADGPTRIHLLTADGEDRGPLTDGVSHGAAVWSPDGMRFACHRDHGDRSDIAVYDLRGRLLGVPVRDGANWYPQWSPDGRCLLFAQQGPPSTPAVPSTGFDLWMTDAWGIAAPQPLLRGPAREAEGRWRPAAED